MQRSILLQINPTKRKYAELVDFSKKATAEYNRLLAERDFCLKFMDFHRKVYSTSKSITFFESNIIPSIERSVWKSKGISKGITVKFNTSHNSKYFETRFMSFVKFTIHPKHRIAVPIVKNRSFQRYESLLKNGWECKTYGLTSDLQIVAYLSKEKVIEPRKNMLGIDINAKHIAVSVVSDKGKVLYQTYFGKNIWIKRNDIMRRRSVMQSNRNFGALRRLRHREYDFVETNIGQMVKEIMNLAVRFDADVSIEKLRSFKSMGKRFNKTAMRIPFYKIKHVLMSRCFDNNITLNIIDSWHTSRWCPKCGAVGKGHDSSNYALFRCKKCSLIMNSDRKASYVIAVKCLLERDVHSNQITSQISNRSGLVNAHKVMSDEVGLPNVAVQHAYQPNGKPSTLVGG